MMVILDRIIIGSVLGAKSVTYYTVPFQLAERTALIPSSLTTALFPRFSAVTLSEQKVLADEAMNILIVTMTPIIAICILFIKPFLLWWVGVEFAHESVLVGQVVLIGFWVNGFARVPFALLQARGKPGLIAKCHLIELLPYFVLLYFALNNLGLLGASLVFTFRVFIDFILLSGLSGSLSSLFRICVIPVIFLAIGFFISYHINIEDMLYFIYVFIYMLFVITWAWWKAPYLLKNQLFGKFKRL
jgi:O-antigen/teichoic acid export membrane protein